MKHDGSNINTNSNDLKVKLAHKLKNDLSRKHKTLFEESKYSQESIFKEIFELLTQIDINKFSNFNKLIKLVEARVLNTANNLATKNSSIVTSNTEPNVTSSKNILTTSQTNPNIYYTEIDPYTKEEEDTRIKAITKSLSLDEINRSVEDAMREMGLNESQRVKEIRRKQEDEWYKIAKLKHQQYLDDVEKQKKNHLETMQKNRENLLNQILVKNEKKKAKREEDDKIIEALKEFNNKIMDQKDDTKKNDIMRKMKDVEESRAKFIIEKRKKREQDKMTNYIENKRFIDGVNKKYQADLDNAAQKKQTQKIILQKFIEENKFYDVKKVEQKAKDKLERLECLRVIEEAAAKSEEVKLKHRKDIIDKMERDNLICQMIYPSSKLNQIKEDLENKVQKDRQEFEHRKIEEEQIINEQKKYFNEDMRKGLKEQVTEKKEKIQVRASQDETFKDFIKTDALKFKSEVQEINDAKKMKIIKYKQELKKQIEMNSAYKKKGVMTEAEQNINKALLSEISKRESNLLT